MGGNTGAVLRQGPSYSRETEYRLTQSVFAPLQDALDRAGLSPKEVSFCLLVGGSTLIPQVREAVQSYFQQAHTITFPDYISVQTAVARGAAWHAFFLAATGKPIVQPVVGDAIALLTGEGEPYQLILPGVRFLFPVDGSYVQLTNLAIPSNDPRTNDEGHYAFDSSAVFEEDGGLMNL